MDNGQHVFLRGCLAYRGLLARLGSEQLVAVQPRLEIPVLSPGGAAHVLRRGSLPAPLHLAGALARYPHLSRPPSASGAARAALALMRLDADDAGLDELTLGEWLARHGQGAEAVAALWDLIALPTLNLPAAQASLALGAFVFRRGCSPAPTRATSASTSGTLAADHRRPGASGAAARRASSVRLGWRRRAARARRGAGFEVHGRGGERRARARR